MSARPESPDDKQEAMRTRHFSSLLADAKKRVITEWGANAFDHLGHRLQGALLAEAVLILAASQDDSISAETVREIVNRGWTWVNDQTDGRA